MHSFIILYLVHFYLEFYLNTSCTYKNEECYSHLFINVFQFYNFFKDHLGCGPAITVCGIFLSHTDVADNP